MKSIIEKIKNFIMMKDNKPKTEDKWLELDTIKFNKSTFNYYKKHVKGDIDIDLETANKKITRNMYLALAYKKKNHKDGMKIWYSYGALRFMVQNSEVKWIENHCAGFPMWYKDWDKYTELSKELGIDEEHVRGGGM